MSYGLYLSAEGAHAQSKRLEVISHNLDAGGETGRAYKTSAIDIYRFKDNKVVERWGNNDGVTLLRQLGLLKE